MEFLVWLFGAAAAGASPPLTPAQVGEIIDVKADGPGCAVALVDGGKIAFERGYGLADLDTKRRITPATSFNVASMTKQFTGMAIALLIADGKLNEQDDIRKYLPELPDYGTPIRIANLLNHSSGLRNHMALAAFQPGDHLPSHEEALKLVFRQGALNFAPGSRHQYESPNYVLLAEIVSRVSGMPYEQFVQRRILEPLGMSDSGYQLTGLARAYAPAEDGGWQLNEKVNGAKGSSGLLSSVHDFALWMINYDRMTIGGKAARERMLSTSLLGDGSPLTYRYGLAKQFDYEGVKGLTRIAHGGQTAAYRSAFSYFPGRGFGDVVMCNFTADAQAKDQAIVDAWFKRHFKVQAAEQAAAVPLPADAEQFAGTYYSAADDDVRTFVLRDGKLMIVAYGEEYPLTHRGGGHFALEGQGEFSFTASASGVSVEERLSDQARLHFTKLYAVAPQPLEQFAGRYRSEDVDGEVVIAPKSDGLALTFPAGTATLRHIAADAFAAPEQDFNHLRFTRDASGRVDGLTLSVSSGITRLRFRRLPG